MSYLGAANHAACLDASGTPGHLFWVSPKPTTASLGPGSPQDALWECLATASVIHSEVLQDQGRGLWTLAQSESGFQEC